MPHGPKRSAAEEEEIFWHYLNVSQSYTITARHFGAPKSSVFEIVRRLGGDDLAHIRTAARVDIVERLTSKVMELAECIDVNELGSGKASRGSEAARAIADMARAIEVMRPDEMDAKPQDDIHVTVSFGEPAKEQVSPTATVTTLPRRD